MPNFDAAISPEDSDEAVRLLTECCNATVNRIIYSEFQGPINLAQLRTYYAGAYRELDAVRELLHQGYRQIPAADLDDDDWERFANSLHIYETCGDLTLFQPWPTPDYDYTVWTEPPAVGRRFRHSTAPARHGTITELKRPTQTTPPQSHSKEDAICYEA